MLKEKNIRDWEQKTMRDTIVAYALLTMRIHHLRALGAIVSHKQPPVALKTSEIRKRGRPVGARNKVKCDSNQQKLEGYYKNKQISEQR